MPTAQTQCVLIQAYQGFLKLCMATPGLGDWAEIRDTWYGKWTKLVLNSEVWGAGTHSLTSHCPQTRMSTWPCTSAVNSNDSRVEVVIEAKWSPHVSTLKVFKCHYHTGIQYIYNVLRSHKIDIWIWKCLKFLRDIKYRGQFIGTILFNGWILWMCQVYNRCISSVFSVNETFVCLRVLTED